MVGDVHHIHPLCSSRLTKGGAFNHLAICGDPLRSFGGAADTLSRSFSSAVVQTGQEHRGGRTIAGYYEEVERIPEDSRSEPVALRVLDLGHADF